METLPAVVFIVDDDADIRCALGRLLRSAGYDARLFRSADEFLAAHDFAAPGCAIFDLEMPGFDGLALQRLLSAAGCHRSIIFLTSLGNIPLTVSAVRAGAVNVLTKPVDEESLLCAVDEAVRIDADARDIGRSRSSVQERLARLTPRERQVLEQVVAGRLNKQIATDLGTVEKTIKVHRARVMQKMGASSLADLVRMASAAGIGGEMIPRVLRRVQPYNLYGG
jgi:FixJ family two-component response regulator